MRLTLRNMLAYMDELLEPAQREEIKQKIDESEFATGIMHRIRDVTRRIRLGAPKLTGKGMGLDPNTVAMYLDNTLSSERVPDFEKVCLESDVHLAEVAACHQVLALVLGEPAEVDPTLRRKLYDVVQRSAPPEPAKVPPPLPIGDKLVHRERPHVPEYLRKERRSRWWTVAATLVLALLLVGVVVRTLGPFDRSNPALALLLGDEEAVTTDAASQPQNGAATAGEERAKEEAAAQKTTNGDATSAADAAKAANGTKLNNPLQEEGKAIPPDGPQLPAETDAKAPIPPEPADADATKDNASPTADIPAKDPALATEDTKQPTEDATSNEQLTNENSAQVKIEPLGRFLTDPNVLLRLNRRGDWQRVSQGNTLNAGDRLLVLPTYRPTITLTAGFTVQVLGETLVELLPPDETGAPGLRIPYGRVVLMTAGKPDVSVRLSLDSHDGTATFLDAESTLAAEVRRYLPAGANPEQEQPRVAVDLYGSSGKIEWRQSENPQPRQIAGPERVTLSAYPYDTTKESELPNWITAEVLSGFDELSTTPMNRALTEDNERPVALIIREFVDHRRVELRYLAARSLALIDEFDPLIPAFNDYDQRAVWPQQVKSLQAALARGPETAAKVREAFEKQRGESAKDLYRMLWGYSKTDIQNGAATQLVEYLDHENLDFRVLALYALKSVPGVKTDWGYSPGAPVDSRRQPLRRWRDSLKTGPLSPQGALDHPGPIPSKEAKAPADSDE